MNPSRGEQARERAAAAEQRAEQLRARLRRALLGESLRGSTAEEVELARVRAQEARDRLRTAIEQSALAHDLAAAAHDLAADPTVADDPHLAKAMAHRRAAAEDRNLLDPA